MFISVCRKDKITWECNNGGQLWSESVASGYETTAAFPSTFCSAGASSISTVFIVSLLIDLACQVRLLKTYIEM